jgi:hypothetical protein
MRSLSFAAGLVAALSIVGVIDGDQTALGPSNTEASKILENIWAATSFVPVRLGEIKVLTPMTQDRANPVNGVVDNRGEQMYDLLRRSGILDLQQNRDLSKESFSWDNFARLSQQDTRRTFVALLTPAYRSLLCNTERARILKLPSSAEYACLPQGYGQVEAIVRNKSREIGADRFQLVFGTHRWKWDPLWITLGQGGPEERKFRALLRYDDFSKKWSLAAIDEAEREQDFVTDTVGTLLTTGTAGRPSAAPELRGLVLEPPNRPGLPTVSNTGTGRAGQPEASTLAPTPSGSGVILGPGVTLNLSSPDNTMVALKSEDATIRRALGLLKAIDVYGLQANTRFEQDEQVSFLVSMPPGKWGRIEDYKVYKFSTTKDKRTTLLNDQTGFRCNVQQSGGGFAKVIIVGRLSPGEYVFAPINAQALNPGTTLALITFGVDHRPPKK